MGESCSTATEAEPQGPVLIAEAGNLGGQAELAKKKVSVEQGRSESIDHG